VWALVSPPGFMYLVILIGEVLLHLPKHYRVFDLLIL